jgi:hypothetical protein
MLGVTSTECVATFPGRSLTDEPQSVSMTAAEKGKGGVGIGRLLYVTVLAFQLRRNSCISAWSPTSYTVYLKSARKMGAIPESALKSNFISTKSTSVLRAAVWPGEERQAHVSKEADRRDEAVRSSS